MQITPFQIDHPNDAFGHHIEYEGKRVLMCFDTEFKRMSRSDLDQDLAYYQGADLIIFDGQYTIADLLKKINWGHCSPNVGVDLCLREGIPRLVIVCHDPASSDEHLYKQERQVEQYFRQHYKEIKSENPEIAPLEIVWGYQGLCMEV